MSKHHTKKRIKNKHKHHEDLLRQRIEEEIFSEVSEQMTKYQKRIDYLIGGNNELASMLKAAEDRCRELERNQEGCVPVPNITADCIILEDCSDIDEGFENF